MSTNDKTNKKLDTQNNDEAIAEVSATEAETIAGGMLKPPPIGTVPDQKPLGTSVFGQKQ